MILAATACLILIGCNQKPDKDSVNAVIGDISYEEEFGSEPDKNADEQTRIKTHLKYVEEKLRKKDVSHLSPELRKRRAEMLDLLHDYRTAGEFPVNYDYPNERRPCFIDKNGNICAVGYLIEQTAGREFAEKINASFQYSYLLDIDLPELANWVAKSGLTLKECAMIQPAYSQIPTNDTETNNYEISSTVFSGVNASLATINVTQIGNSPSSKAMPIAGLVSGAGQVVLGAIEFPEAHEYPFSYDKYNRLKTTSLINIGVGTTTLLLSTYNLISNREPKIKKTSWGVFSYPTRQNQVGVGFSLSRRF